MLNYIWQRTYESALTETDPVLLRTYIMKSRDAMIERLKVLATDKDPVAREEYEAIRDAEAQMRVVERTFLREGTSFPAHAVSP